MMIPVKLHQTAVTRESVSCRHVSEMSQALEAIYFNESTPKG